MRKRVSLVKEDRILDLLNQGYGYNAIAAICNVSRGNLTNVKNRLIRRHRHPNDPWKGRKRGMLSDAQIEEIRDMREAGVSVASIANRFRLSVSCVHGIVSHRSYVNSEEGYPFDFTNRTDPRLL